MMEINNREIIENEAGEKQEQENDEIKQIYHAYISHREAKCRPSEDKMHGRFII